MKRNFACPSVKKDEIRAAIRTMKSSKETCPLPRQYNSGTFGALGDLN